MYKDFKRLNIIAVEYVKNIKCGINSKDNFNKLFQAFGPVIDSLIKTIKHNQYIDVDDLKQEAYICLWKCCEKYDFNKTASFYAYFYGCAFNSLTQYVYQHQTPIMVNKNEKGRTKGLREFANQYYTMNKTYPSLNDYIEAGFNKKLSKRFYSYVLNTHNTDFDLNEIENSEDSGLSVEEECEVKDKNKALYNAINELENIDRIVIKLFFFDKLTICEIADKLNISEATVKRHKKKALEILKDNMNDYE